MGEPRRAGRGVGRPMSPRLSLPRTVLALGVVSFLTDLSSEMIYPLLPLFLAAVLGAGALSLGLIEGVAEATASLLKAVSGVWSDRSGRRKPLVLGGYGLSGTARPLIGLAWAWPVVLLLRFADRVGKGLRTSPRDALIADVTPPAMRGRAFGLHRAMDHGGAVVGPLVAAALLETTDLGLRGVFLLAAIPAAAVMGVLAFGVGESPRPLPTEGPSSATRPRASELGVPYRRLLLAVFVFTLGNSTDAFLLLRLADVGLGAEAVALLWSAHHVVKMAATWLGGRFADRWGKRRMVGLGWLVYAVIYVAFGLVETEAALVAVFLAYGIYFGLTEPAEKAWVAELVPSQARGTAFGGYHAVVGLAALPASLLFGALWQALDMSAAFFAGAALALVASAALLRVPERR